MGLFSWLFAPQKRASLENPSVSLNDPAAWEEAGLSTPRTKSGVRVTQKKALGHAPLWSGINLLARSVARMRPIVYRNDDDGGHKRDTQHLAYQLLRRKPNRWVTAGTFLKTLTYHQTFFGNGYALVSRDNAGRIVPLKKGGGLIILSPTETFPIQRKGEVWYSTTIAGKQEFLPAEDVLHIKGLSYDGLVGHSLIEILADALAVGISARDYAARFFAQGANASGILMIPGTLNPQAQEQAIKSFERIVSGAKNQHKVGVLQSDVKWQPLSVNPEQSQLLGSQEFDLRVVANVLRIPPHKIGDVTRQGYASLEQENQSFLDDSLEPILGSWEEELEDKMLGEVEKDNDTHQIEFNRNALLKADLMTRYRAYAIGRQWGWLNVNTIRRKENEEPIGPEGDTYLQPSNMTPAGAADPNNPNQSGQDLSQNKDATRQAAIDAVIERLTHLAGIESEQIRRAAKREANFVGWMETYYGERAETYDEVLAPLVKVWASSVGRASPAFCKGVAMQLSHRLIDRAKEQLLRIAGGCTQAELPSALEKFSTSTDETELRALVTETLGVQ